MRIIDGRILCGFAGIGKSTLARKRANVVDLESTPFQRDWVTYARVANHMKNNGYTVLVSCHKELREQLHKDCVKYDVVLPSLDLKEVFMQRYINRGNTEDFIKLLDEKWENFCEELPWECAIRIGTEFLADIIPTVDPEELRPKGRWEEEVDGTHFCSRCGYGAPYAWGDIDRHFRDSADDVPDRPSNYCPNCGAKMEDAE